MMMRNRRMVMMTIGNLRMGGRDRTLGMAWRHSHRMMCSGMPTGKVVHFAMVESRGGHRRGKASWMLHSVTNNQCQVSSVRA